MRRATGFSVVGYHRGMRTKILRVSTLITAASLAYLQWGRTRLLAWGATADESARALPGDELVPHARGMSATRGVTIDAPAERVWPLIMQRTPPGRARGGGRQWQVMRSDVGRCLLLASALPPGAPDKAVADTWVFFLESLPDGRTRLLERRRSAGEDTLAGLPAKLFRELVDFLPVRSRLLGIKARAESGQTGR